VYQPVDQAENVASLLRAWRAVVDATDRARLRIVGDGSERENLEELADALYISVSVTFEGHVTEERKWELLDRVSAFVLSSLQEGFGIYRVAGGDDGETTGGCVRSARLSRLFEQ